MDKKNVMDLSAKGLSAKGLAAKGSGIGQPVRRREDLRLVRGAGRYIKRPAFAPAVTASPSQKIRSLADAH